MTQYNTAVAREALSEGKLPEDKDSETGQYDKYGLSSMTQ